MRLDKFLKISRAIKRRTVANEACDAGRITVNSKTAKASYEVKINDIIEIRYGDKIIKFRINRIPSTVKKEEAEEVITYL